MSLSIIFVLYYPNSGHDKQTVNRLTPAEKGKASFVQNLSEYVVFTVISSKNREGNN